MTNWKDIGKEQAYVSMFQHTVPECASSNPENINQLDSESIIEARTSQIKYLVANYSTDTFCFKTELGKKFL